MEAAGRMLAGRPDDNSDLGRLAAQIGEDAQELWAENLPTVEVFADMMTQWNVGPGGVVGLRYEALPVVLDLHAIPATDRPGVFAGLRVMERAALEQFRG